MAEFNIAELMKGVSRADTGREQISYLPHGQIFEDAANGYSMDGIGELARSIEIVGLQQPLRVRPIEGLADGYRIISGHRRFAAVTQLIEQGSQRFADGVPCIIDSAAASDALRELQLLLGNADNRKMSAADEAQQAERISDCLRRLEDEGYKFPGRHRDWVSKLSGLSRSKIGRLEAIKRNLSPGLYRDLFLTGEIGETVAYALSQQNLTEQLRIVELFQKNGVPPKRITEANVSDYAELTKKTEKLKCPVVKGSACTNRDGIRDKCLFGGWGYKPCRYGDTCCAKCSEYLNCKHRCPLLNDKARAERAKKREANAGQRAADASRNEANIQAVEHVWARYGAALAAAGLTDKQLRKQLGETASYKGEYDIYMRDNRIAALTDFSCTDVKPNESMPFHYSFHADDYRHLCAMADALGCSLDYLFCRSDDPRPAPVSSPDTKPGWHTGEPESDGRYLCLVDLQTGPLHEQRCDRTGGVWMAYGQPVKDMFTVVAWWPLPNEDRTGYSIGWKGGENE